METSSTNATLTRIGQLLDGVDVAGRAKLTDQERLDLVQQARVVSRRVEALLGVLVAEADAAQSARKVAGVPTTSWLALAGDLSAREAAGLVFGGRDVAASHQVRDAALAGQVSLAQARAVNRAMQAMPEALPAHQQAAARAALLERAQSTPSRELAKLGDEVLAEVAPEALPTADGRVAQLAVQRRRALHARYLQFHAPEAGSMAFEGSLPLLEATQFKTMIETMVAADKRAGRDQAADQADLLAMATRTNTQRQADALFALVSARSGSQTGTLPSAPHHHDDALQLGQQDARHLVHDETRPLSSADGTLGAPPLHSCDSTRPTPATVMVVVEEQALHARAEQNGLLLDGTGTGSPISAGELRRLCCDAELVPVVLGSQSEIVDLGQAVRLVTPELRRALVFRDQGCVFPGCDKPPHACEAHHLVPWWQGGATALSNLVLLCPHHHGLIEPRRMHPADAHQLSAPGDRLRWTIRMASNGRPEVLPPSRLSSPRLASQVPSGSTAP